MAALGRRGGEHGPRRDRERRPDRDDELRRGDRPGRTQSVTDPKGTTTYTYDDTTDPRGLPVSVTAENDRVNTPIEM